MLPVEHRLRTGAEFRAVTRGPGGARAGSRLLVVHVNRTDPGGLRPPRVGLVVSKAVGGAVVRNRLKRRLRAQAGALLARVPAGLDLVVRAQPAAAEVDSSVLGAELGRLVDAACARVSVPGRRVDA